MKIRKEWGSAMAKRGELAILACESGKPFALKVSAHIEAIVQKEG